MSIQLAAKIPIGPIAGVLTGFPRGTPGASEAHPDSLTMRQMRQKSDNISEWKLYARLDPPTL
jgi:hypothetical protein